MVDEIGKYGNLPDLDDIPGRAKDFADSLGKMSQYIEKSITAVIRKACLDLYRSIVDKTPVDTGRAKTSWGIEMTQDINSKGQEPQPEGSKFSFQEIESIVKKHVRGFILGVKKGYVIITNNVEYIEFLEDGSSEQAPTGMIAVSLVEFTNHFNKALKDFEGLEPA